MAELDGGLWGNILLGLATLGAGLGWAREKMLKNRVESASADAQVAVAGAQESMFTMLTNRLEALDVDVRLVREELTVERARSRRMETHIYRLESLMRAANMTPPVFEG